MTDYKLTVSVKHQGIMPILDVVQGDSGRNIIMTVADMDVSGCRARVYVVKPSGLDVYNEAAVTNRTITVELTAQMLAEYGNTKMQISIYRGDTIERVSTFAVYLNVEKSLQDTGYINSSTEYKTLDSLIEQAQGVVDEGTAKLDTWLTEKDAEYEEWTANEKQEFNEWTAQRQTEYTNWTIQQQTQYNEWTAEKQAEFDSWTTEKQRAYLQWQDSFKTANTNDFNGWYAQFKTSAENDFNAWFTSIQSELDENQAGNLLQKIDIHEQTTINSIDGVHGMRLSGNEFQVNIGTGWVTIANIPLSMTAEYFNGLNLTANQFNAKNLTAERFNNEAILEVI